MSDLARRKEQFDNRSLTERIGKCRMNPPEYVRLKGRYSCTESGDITGRWPTTFEDDWCMCFVERT